MTAPQVTLVRDSDPQPSYEDGPAYLVLVDGQQRGRVARHRHTYRTTFVGRRYGYDREHTCWWGVRERPGTYRESLRCYRTRADLVAIIAKATP